MSFYVDNTPWLWSCYEYLQTYKLIHLKPKHLLHNWPNTYYTAMAALNLSWFQPQYFNKTALYPLCFNLATSPQDSVEKEKEINRILGLSR